MLPARLVAMSDKENEPALVGSHVSPRLVRTRLVAGFAAAGTMFLYLAVKVAWVIGALAGTVPTAFEANVPAWIALNAVTIGMAAFGVALGLALAQPWGMRLPAGLVLLFAWTASGFLVSLLPYSALAAILSAAGVGSGGEDGTDTSGASLPAWETALISTGFAGMAIGLVVAAPIYMRERWPRAFTGTTADVRPAAIRPRLSAFALAAAAVPTLLWMYWAAGGIAGLNPAARELWVLDSRLLVGTSAVWALLGAWSAWTLSGRGRRRVPLGLPMTVGFIASGSLFAWNTWRILWALLPITDQEPLRTPAVAVAEHGTATAAGIAMLVIIVRAYRNNSVSPNHLSR